MAGFVDFLCGANIAGNIISAEKRCNYPGRSRVTRLVMYMASFTFLLVHCGSLVSTLVLSSETECLVALQWSPTTVGMVRLVCSLKRFPSGRLVSLMYTCAGS